VLASSEPSKIPPYENRTVGDWYHDDESASAHMTTHVNFKKICKVPGLPRRKVLNKNGTKKKNRRSTALTSQST
jgi:hypothetical protein